ncbi:zf-HC2 domain-containing protein [Amedibacterium intestinale]|jgi:hypothetical protein|uniref:zf-HC2 domain-containing protein n=1 Tax=Amedibacterium intestinale TaxID=2583452 RepID=UPI000E4C7CEC|nr:zf-HC2 domain-containing protein [Amedibacterium intestinale]RHO32461.1 hypothetical protein DW208_03385 [Erysipelotrichaceae bacterium AM17-60]BBK61911.1 hypothetical protein A9CBEGH2_08510 [Amedibacterium intestinale]
MRYPCKLIQDILPLYHDGVCSQESKEIVEQHFSDCEECRKYYDDLCGVDAMEPDRALNKENEMKKAESFKGIKKRLLKKQVLLILVSFAVFFVLIFSVIGSLKHTKYIIPYENNIFVSMIDNQLIGRLQGNEANHLRIKRVETMNNNQKTTYLFFCMSSTKWDEIVTSDKVYSEYLLSSSEKGANEIDKVYYYTGDYTNLEEMDEAELQTILPSCELLWSK